MRPASSTGETHADGQDPPDVLGGVQRDTVLLPCIDIIGEEGTLDLIASVAEELEDPLEPHRTHARSVGARVQQGNRCAALSEFISPLRANTLADAGPLFMHLCHGPRLPPQRTDSEAFPARAGL